MSRQSKVPELVTRLVESQPRLQGYLLSLTADREATQELLQATNLVIWQKSEEFEPGTNFIAWAFQIARYQVLAYRKRVSRERLRFSDAFVESLAARADSEEGGEPAARVVALRHCLGQLSPDRRAALEFRYGKGLGVPEIARSMERTAAAVEKLLVRTRAALLECVERRTRGESQL